MSTTLLTGASERWAYLQQEQSYAGRWDSHPIAVLFVANPSPRGFRPPIFPSDALLHIHCVLKAAFSAVQIKFN